MKQQTKILTTLDELEYLSSNMLKESENIKDAEREFRLNSFNSVFEQFKNFELKEQILDKKANNLMHDLEQQMKALLLKHKQLVKFEEQVITHFQSIANTKNEITEKFKHGQPINKSQLDQFTKALKFIGKEIQEEHNYKYNIKEDIKTAQEKLEKIKSFIKNDES